MGIIEKLLVRKEQPLQAEETESMLMIRRDYIRSGLMIEDFIDKFNATSKALGDHIIVIQQIEEENFFK